MSSRKRAIKYHLENCNHLLAAHNQITKLPEEFELNKTIAMLNDNTADHLKKCIDTVCLKIHSTELRKTLKDTVSAIIGDMYESS